MGKGPAKKQLSKWMVKNGDAIVTVKDSRESDVIIPVMGATGVGKSTFINTAVASTVTPVGHDLESCTTEIQHFFVPYPGDPTRRIVFVDTPGFDDTYTGDAEILRLLAIWLARSYYDGMKLAGIIYLHEITQTRFETSRDSMVMFNKLCGNNALKNVVLATTKWGDIGSDVGQRREQQLSQAYWKQMLAQGSRMARFTNTHESAWAIVSLIIQKDPMDTLLIQKELVDHRKHLPKTAAGRSLSNPLPERKVAPVSSSKRTLGCFIC